MAQKRYNAPPQMVIDHNKRYMATFRTEAGDFQVELFAAQAPQTVNNFVFLARDGFYNNTPFHPVIPGFMAQGRDPTGPGTREPAYKFADDPAALGLEHNRAGILSRPNSGPKTNDTPPFF